MNKVLSNSILKAYRRPTFVLAAVVLVLLASCPVKRGIKSLAGIPVNTEHSIAKGSYNLFGNGPEKCVNGETADPEITSPTFSRTNSLLPALLHTADFLFPAAYTRRREASGSFYGNLKIPGRLPIFLQYRKLVI